MYIRGRETKSARQSAILNMPLATPIRKPLAGSWPLVTPTELSYTMASMCLAVPALITKIEGTLAEAELAGNETSVNILFTPDVKVGDYVIMHAGYAISVMSTSEAQETLELLGEMAGLDAEE